MHQLETRAWIGSLETPALQEYGQSGLGFFVS
jgi:hypothetical protein